MRRPHLTIEDYKQQAKTLRFEVGSDTLTHSAALEVVAKQNGHRDWNTLCAGQETAPRKPGFQTGQRISGTYLGHSFSGTVKAAQMIGDLGHHRLTIRFDDPVDVVQFDSFSSLRQQINCTIDHTRQSLAKTSDGQQHVILNG